MLFHSVMASGHVICNSALDISVCLCWKQLLEFWCVPLVCCLISACLYALVWAYPEDQYVAIFCVFSLVSYLSLLSVFCYIKARDFDDSHELYCGSQAVSLSDVHHYFLNWSPQKPEAENGSFWEAFTHGSTECAESAPAHIFEVQSCESWLHSNSHLLLIQGLLWSPDSFQ